LLTRPWLIPAIVAIWAMSMTWLVTAKIVPTWGVDTPPGNQQLFSTGNKLTPVAWSVLWNDSPVGYSISQARRLPSRGLEVDSLLHLDMVPVDELLPQWLQTIVRPGSNQRIVTSFDARGKVALDAHGSLQTFTSSILLPNTENRITLNGVVRGGVVSIGVDASGILYEFEKRIPDGVMIGDELSPQATLPNLSIGRKWTVPTYNPLRPSGASVELLHAHVSGERMFFWQDTLTRVHEVSYRIDPTTPHHEPQFMMLVDMNGRVVKQESLFLGARLTFVRRSDQDAMRLARGLDRENSVDSPATTGSPPSDTETGSDQ
jgi:hypothetical protein